MNREEVLDAAREIVTADRLATHGSPEDSFGRIAGLWSAYLGQELSARDVAAMMSLLKVARIRNNPDHPDNWIDLAGYAACGGALS